MTSHTSSHARCSVVRTIAWSPARGGMSQIWLRRRPCTWLSCAAPRPTPGSPPIDTDAGALPGVVGVFTAKDLDLVDIPGDSIAVDAPDFPRPHLAREKVRYVGEPVAVVAANSASRCRRWGRTGVGGLRAIASASPIPAPVFSTRF